MKVVQKSTNCCNTVCGCSTATISADSVDYLSCLQANIPDCNDVVPFGDIQSQIDYVTCLQTNIPDCNDIEVITPLPPNTYTLREDGNGDFSTVEEMLTSLNTESGYVIVHVYGEFTVSTPLLYSPIYNSISLVMHVDSIISLQDDLILSGADINFYGMGRSKSTSNVQLGLSQDYGIQAGNLLFSNMGISGSVIKGTAPTIKSDARLKMFNCWTDPEISSTDIDIDTGADIVIRNSNLKGATLDVSGIAAGDIFISNSNFAEITHATGIALSAENVIFNNFNAATNVTYGNTNSLAGVL